MAIAQLAIRDLALSAQLVRMIGTLAPSPARRYPHEPGSLAAWRLIALSNAKGPPTTAPEICPRSVILQRLAASVVAGIVEVTVSTAARIAIFGFSGPNEIARSIAF